LPQQWFWSRQPDRSEHVDVTIVLVACDLHDAGHFVHVEFPSERPAVRQARTVRRQRIQPADRAAEGLSMAIRVASASVQATRRADPRRLRPEAAARGGPRRALSMTLRHQGFSNRTVRTNRSAIPFASGT